MIRTASVTQLRDNLAETLKSLDHEPAVIVLRNSKPAAYLVSPALFERLLDRIEDLEDAAYVQAALIDYRAGLAAEAEDVFSRLGL